VTACCEFGREGKRPCLLCQMRTRRELGASTSMRLHDDDPSGRIAARIGGSGDGTSADTRDPAPYVREDTEPRRVCMYCGRTYVDMVAHVKRRHPGQPAF
jgi:hypothetical protein